MPIEFYVVNLVVLYNHPPMLYKYWLGLMLLTSISLHSIVLPMIYWYSSVILAYPKYEIYRIPIY